MKEEIKAIQTLIAENKTEATFVQLQNIFSLTNSELVNDVLLLAARKKKLDSDVRKGIIAYDDQTLVSNQINNGVLSLLQELKNNPALVNKYHEVKEQIQQDYLEKTKVPMPEKVRDILLQRLAYLKNKNLKIKGLWIDDGTPNPAYLDLFQSVGIHFECVQTSDIAFEKINTESFDVIISDIAREGKNMEGLDFHKKLIKADWRIPTIFFIANLNPNYGTPPYAFGITRLLSELIHLVIDVVERRG